MYGGVRMMVAPSMRNTSSKPPMNWPVPSRIKNQSSMPTQDRVRAYEEDGPALAAEHSASAVRMTRSSGSKRGCEIWRCSTASW